jgi:hypothetical protein
MDVGLCAAKQPFFLVNSKGRLVGGSYFFDLNFFPFVSLALAKEKHGQKILSIHQHTIRSHTHDADHGLCGPTPQLWFGRGLVYKILKCVERNVAGGFCGGIHYYSQCKETDRADNERLIFILNSL